MIPTVMLNKVYATGSLRNAEDGVRFEILNLLMDIERVAVRHLAIDDDPVPVDRLRLALSGEGPTGWINGAQPFSLPLEARVTFLLPGRELPKGTHKIEVGVEVPVFGEMRFTAEDTISNDSHSDAGAPLCTSAAYITQNENNCGASGSGVGSREKTEAPDTLLSLYDASVRLLTSSMETYIDVQKKLLDIAIPKQRKRR